MRLTTWRLSIVLVGLVSGSASAAGPTPRETVARVTATPVQTATAVHLDGALNEEIWATAPKVSEFVQRDPKEGAPATFPTEARVVYDSDAIYVAVWALDPDPAKIVGLLTRRDGDSPSDWVAIILDSYHDRRTAYEFSVNPAGVKSDTYWFADTNEDQSWDAVWDVQVSKDAKGWKAEFRIPFSQLRFDPRSDGTFGFAVIREIARLKETSSWPLLAKAKNGVVSQFGELVGLTFTKSPRRLELVPYTVGQIATQPPEAAIRSCRARSGQHLRRRREVRGDARSQRDGDDQPRLRPGRGRPGRRQPQCLRDVLRGAPPVLRRGFGHVPVQRRLQRRRVHGAVLLAPDRPRARRARPTSRRRVRVVARPDDDHRRGQAHGPRRLVLGRRAQRRDGRRARADCGRGGSAPRRPSSRSRATRSAARGASSPTSRRSASC